jgi:2-oxoglutarate dehydrogenase E2 component (dihydrolipoamide succinyltransferase)
MSEIKVPMLPESIADALVAKWHKQAGDFVREGDNLIDLETDKVMLEVPATQDGVLGALLVKEGDTVVAEQALTSIKAGKAPAESQPSEKQADEVKHEAEAKQEIGASAAAPESAMPISPAVRRLLDTHEVDALLVKGTGKDGRLTTADVKAVVDNQGDAAKSATQQSEPARVSTGPRTQERVPMSRLRARIAERLVQAQQTAAMLTTFNEVDMHAVMQLRSRYKDQFEKTHDTKLGFMSFFVSACVAALKEFPEVNASIDGNDVLYHHYFDIGIAVSSPRGLVVPVLRDAQNLSMAGTEKQIKDCALRAREGKLTLEEMTGGTFTITNGGVFGSMLSTPILNPPQSAILGMHNIIQRPVVVEGAIEIRPMMYLALSYDHRIIDGSQSVRFLVKVKQILEDPSRLLLAV